MTVDFLAALIVCLVHKIIKLDCYQFLLHHGFAVKMVVAVKKIAAKIVAINRVVAVKNTDVLSSIVQPIVFVAVVCFVIRIIVCCILSCCIKFCCCCCLSFCRFWKDKLTDYTKFCEDGKYIELNTDHATSKQKNCSDSFKEEELKKNCTCSYFYQWPWILNLFGLTLVSYVLQALPNILIAYYSYPSKRLVRLSL